MEKNSRNQHSCAAELLAEELLRRIWCGIYKVHTQMPGTAELAREFSLGQYTVYAAIRKLDAMGCIKRHPGRRPLVVLPRRKSFYRIALTGFDCINNTVITHNMPPLSNRRGLFKESVVRSLQARRAICAEVDTDDWHKVQDIVDGVVHLSLVDAPSAPPDCGSKPLLVIKNALEDVLQVNTVYTERDQALEKAAYYMISHGIRQVLSLQNGVNALHSEREKRLEKLLREQSSAACPIVRLVTAGIGEKHAVMPLKNFLNAAPRLPLAIFAQGDWLAKGAAQTVAACGLQLKKDVVIIGCTGMPEAAAWHPAVSTLASPFPDMGEAAAAGIIKLIGDNLKELAPQIIHGQLFIRET